MACDSFLSATLAHVRYLRATGRLTDPENDKDIAELEDLRRNVRQSLEAWREDAEHSAKRLQLPPDPGRRLAFAARRELRLYREAVCEDARRLRASSSAIVGRCRAARRLRALGDPLRPNG